MRCTHFIGFRDSKSFWLASQVFGKPDFIHVKWDIRSAYGGELHPDDILIFAEKEREEDIYPFSVDDSAEGIPND